MKVLDIKYFKYKPDFQVFLMSFIRYHHVKAIVNKQSDERLKFKKLNVFAYLVGLVAALGISLVGNFQETNIISIHLVGTQLIKLIKAS